jgi:hypothetical protein
MDNDRTISFSLLSFKGPRGFPGVQGDKGDKVSFGANSKDGYDYFHLKNESLG